MAERDALAAARCRTFSYGDAVERRARDAVAVEAHRVAPEWKVPRAVPVALEPGRAAPPVEHDLPGAVDAAARDVHARDMGEQIRQRLDVREHERVGVERITRAARQRPGEDRNREYGEIKRQGVAGGRIAGGRVPAG